jgi:hypothetical protein
MSKRSVVIIAVFVGLACLASVSCTDQQQTAAKQEQLSKAPPLPTITCRRATGPVRIDGLLGEPAWRNADTAKLQLNAAGPPSHATDIRILWDQTCLYVAFECEDPQPSASLKKHDDPLWEDGNVVEVFIDPAGKGWLYYEFEVNPLNTKIDLLIDLQKGRKSWKQHCLWNAEGWRSAVNIRRKPGQDQPIGWSVEMAIPLKNFKTSPHMPPQTGDVWRINFYRYNTVEDQAGKKQELYAWSPTMKGGFHVPSRFGFLRFAD